MLSFLTVQIDVANKKLCIDGDKVSSFQKVDTIQQSVQLVKFGRVFAPVHMTILPGQEMTT